jgi:hypothetical protein
MKALKPDVHDMLWRSLAMESDWFCKYVGAIKGFGSAKTVVIHFDIS